MSNNIQIAQLYDGDPQITVQHIAEQLGYEEGAVKMVLAACSKRYRKEIRQADDMDTVIDDDMYEAAKMTLYQLMIGAENEKVRADIAKFAINEKKGRHDKKEPIGINVNINNFNDIFAKAHDAIKAAKAKVIEKPEEALQLENAV